MGRKKVDADIPLELLSLFRNAVLKKLYLFAPKDHREELLPESHKQHFTHLLDMITRTVRMGESNSLLLIGPRGSGKSMLLQCVLNTAAEFLDDVAVIRLAGLLQTDDRLALQEITRQLQLENTAGDKVFGSFAENLLFLLESLKQGGKVDSKPIILILDDFDLFCHHRNQTLLYNLFDVAQSAQAPICVIGLTCYLDVVELLEKRVKSRFSNRQIHLFNDLDFDAYFSAMLSLLSITEVDNELCLKGISLKDSIHHWNNHVSTLCHDTNVKHLVKLFYEKYRDIRTLKEKLFLVVSQLTESDPYLNKNLFTEVFTPNVADDKTNMLLGLSLLELSLVIAMKHLYEIYDGEPFNFEMIYHQYAKFTQRRSSMQCFEKPVVMKAFEILQALELVRPVDHGNSKVQKEYQLFQMNIYSSHINIALQQYTGLPTELEHWANSNFA